MQTYPQPHKFHIPVMGLAFTIDSPIKVARYGISSVMSIIQDNLIEKMRSYYYPWFGEVYEPINEDVADYRAKRITDYLNLVKRIVDQQIATLKETPFGEGSDIDKYFSMLPDDSELKLNYERMKSMEDSAQKFELQNWLRSQIKAGGIDVNIMTKLDKPNLDSEGNPITDGSDAVAALRGFTNSTLTNSSMVLSAGMNPRLFAYMEGLPAFEADANGEFQKKIVIKVSDYRSALLQGKMLAKKGLWTSEFRIESGLNCGGHAFATDGHLIGPILEEFKNKREELIQELHTVYNNALVAQGKTEWAEAHDLKVTFQGGIGTHDECRLLADQYGIQYTGWGTPFLLVPEATTVDDDTFELLKAAKERDVVLSKNSPLGVRFHYLKGTTSEKEKFSRIAKGKPGSPCTEKFLVSNTEFTKDPICTASRAYQKRKVAEIKALVMEEKARELQLQEVLDKECLCVGLSNAAVENYHVSPFKVSQSRNVCPGPNIAYFSEEMTLQQMVDHIYGRTDVIQNDNRPHFFIKELSLYIEYWKELLLDEQALIDNKKKVYIQKFYNNLITGIAYYRELSQNTPSISDLRQRLNAKLDEAESLLTGLLALKMPAVAMGV
jgi:hypothetical protein